MSYPTFAGSRVAPAWFHNAPTLRNQELWRGLVWAVVPMSADTGTGGTFRRAGRELVKGVSNSFAGGVVIRGEANGPALSAVAAGCTFGTPLPTAVPFACFAFIVNRGTSSGIRTLINASGVGGGGWTFQLDYGVGQLGMTRWGIADSPTVVLGAVPVAGAVSCVGVSMDGTNARFFLNGRFENVVAASVTAPSGGQNTNLFHRAGLTPPEDCSAHVVYVWNRALRDSEFLALMQDPWAIVRPAEVPFTIAAAPSGSSARVFVPAFIG